jgi:hypothetical protein
MDVRRLHRSAAPTAKQVEALASALHEMDDRLREAERKLQYVLQLLLELSEPEEQES